MFQKIHEEDFYEESVYNTVRRCIGRGVWMKDYTDQIEDEHDLKAD